MAKEFYGLFDPTPSDRRPYGQSEIAAMFRAMGGTGAGNGLTVRPTVGMEISVDYGYAGIHGFLYALMDDGGGAKTFLVSAAGSADRWDRIILTLDLSTSARSITMGMRQGTPASDPVPPALVNTDVVKEISIARVKVRAGTSSITATDIVDEKEDTGVCGRLTLDYLQPSVLELMYGTLATPESAGKMSAEDKAALDSLVSEWIPATEQLQDDVADLQARTVVNPYPVMLPASGWAQEFPYRQTVAVPGVMHDSVVWVGYASGYRDAFQAAGVYALDQEGDQDGSITFACDVIPFVDIGVSIAFTREGLA